MIKRLSSAAICVAFMLSATAANAAYYGFDGRNYGEPCAGVCLETRQHAGMAAMGLCCGRFCRFCRNVADIGRVHRHFDGDIQSPDDLPELDLSGTVPTAERAAG